MNVFPHVRDAVDGTMNMLAQQFPHLFPEGMNPMASGNASEYGDDTLADEIPKQKGFVGGLVADAMHMGPSLLKNIRTLLEEVYSKASGKPYDDKTYLMERVIELVASLPTDSKNREKLTFTLIEGMWKTLDHPPLSYYSDKYMYRTADGSYNNVNNPLLGAGGQPYARTVRAAKALHGCEPDPGLLFDLLMRREDGKFAQNPAGISAVLFYHATLIVHDLFNTSHENNGINKNSSYLDLQVLYGNSQEAQDTIRTFKDGKLKPDAFWDKRILHQPPGACIYLIMYNRYHNWVCDRLAAINEGDRFSIPPGRDPRYTPEDSGKPPPVNPMTMLKKLSLEELQKLSPEQRWEERLKNMTPEERRDQDLFQTARLITTSMFMSVSLGDYIRAITNIPSSDSTWTLDPRLEIKPQPGFPNGLERGVGNHVSVEFNLLYRFHAPVSRKDEQWMADFFDNEVFKDRPKGTSVPELSLQDHLKYFKAWGHKHDPDPGKNTFGGLQRDPKTGMFDTTTMVDMFASSIADPAGAFGAHNVPKHMRVIEMLGILESRRWHVASLNETRDFFGLKRHQTFEDINSDPRTADILRKLYEHPDMVELYPGLFVEDTKKVMEPGSAITPQFTIGRAILSDAITLIRGDRFATHDFTAGTLTSWGIQEVTGHRKTLGGQLLYRLIHRVFPGYFAYDSAYAMQPMYTPDKTMEFARRQGTAGDFSAAPPRPPPVPTMLNTHAAIQTVLDDNRNFRVFHEGTLPTSLVFSDFCLSGDSARNTKNHQLLAAGLADCPAGGGKTLQYWFEQATRNIVAREAFCLAGALYQVDVVKDVAQVVAVHLAAELCNLPLRTRTEPDEAMSEDDLYAALSTFLRFTGFPLDGGDAWNLRRDACERTDPLKRAVMARVRRMERGGRVGIALLNGAYRRAPAGSLRAAGEQLTKRLLAEYGAEDTAASLVGCAAGAMFLPHQFSVTLDWFLREENAPHWELVKRLARDDGPDALDRLTSCVLEGQRLASAMVFERVCVPADGGDAVSIAGDGGAPVTLKKGDVVMCNVTAALRDPKAYPQPAEFHADRNFADQLPYGWGPHMCLGRDISVVGITAMIKEVAKLGNLRRAPGDQGRLKSVPGPLGGRSYMDKTWSKFSPFASTMKVHFDSLKA